MDNAQVQRDALDIAECMYIGDWDRYWDVVERYTQPETPAAELTFALSFLIKQATFSSAGLFDTAPDFFALCRNELPPLKPAA
ncbi:hypothetical protein [Rhodococcoides corynebacterioides]|uniref:Uncharacterized protein n=1 Tax=Rhodococcoides corynebacterioides TaxID=53972 RepID=A0ABS7P3T8_9NOCA|nr:hypothetical protein [Rhodococcus corynebacterioides]MBY6367081.1 hypothetical protein [Rhodococcus corynebacterioides]MBY6407342.1 hypothetical protein [Rhodococcus corynebacterioides]